MSNSGFLRSRAMKSVLAIIIVIIFMVIGRQFFGALSNKKFQAKVLLDNEQYMVTGLTISPDSKWLIMRFMNTPTKLIAINLENGTKEGIKYLDYLSEKANCDYEFSWSNNNELILREEEAHNYYLLNVKESNTTLKLARDFSPQGRKFGFWLFDTDYFCFRMGNARERYEEKFPELRLELFSLPYTSIDTLSVSPNRKYIFYLLSWQNRFWNSQPNCLYFLDTQSKKSQMIDKDIMAWDPIIMFWAPDSKKFIYGKRLEPNGVKIIELTLQER